MRASSNTKVPFEKTNESADFGRDTRVADFAEKVRVNQQMLRAKSKSNYDFIICGSGPAGSVVARRLAENPDVSVLLLEAGGSDDVPEVMNPAQWARNLGSERDWAFLAQPNSHLNGRSIPLSMGKVLGGGSSINVMVWARGHKNDWEHFAELSGDPGWGYHSVLGIYRRAENWQGAHDPVRRGVGGPVYVEPASNPQPIALAMVEAVRSLGMPSFDSPNGEMMEGRGGVAVSDLIIRDGQRSSVFRDYVYPRLDQPNLTVLTHTLVTKLIFTGSTAVGVEVIQDGKTRRYEADQEVILSLGAINTPKVLLQSGIGPQDDLKRHGIQVIQHLPGVGQNHQDHVSFNCIFEYREPQAMGNGGGEATLYWKSDPSLDRPDMFYCQLQFPVPSAETAALGVPDFGWTMFPGLAHPKSRGSLRLSGPKVSDPILIDANTLSHPDDLKAAISNIEFCRQIGSNSAFNKLVRREAIPGNLSPGQMENFARNAAVTYWHQCGTAKMGRDPMSVVDSRLKVYGVEKLRIADASIMPEITSGNTMAPCVVIGERAAEMVKAAYGISQESPLKQLLRK
jgi:choline dehydrogenase